MAVNLSDIAAMAGRPVAAVVSVGLPRRGGRALAEELYRGLREIADAFDTALAGGGSIRGKHLDFTPRVREALRLHELAELHAMIDVSDGLAADVAHLCEESRCGAVLRAEAVPVSDAARALNDGRSPLEHALADGEDVELVFPA